MRKVAVVLFAVLFCANTASAQENAEMVAARLAAHIEKYVSDRIEGTIGDPSRTEIVNLFTEVFNNRHSVGRSWGDGIYDYEEQQRKNTQLRGKVFELWNGVLDSLASLGDGQDVRNADFKNMVILMTLAVITPDYRYNFIEDAKRTALSDTWYGYPNHYAILVFFDSLLKLEYAIGRQSVSRGGNPLSDATERITARLQELAVYLSGVLESDKYDFGDLLEQDITFINSIIRQMQQ
jgi:hypothetical protein